jgi:hypothetical protein
VAKDVHENKQVELTTAPAAIVVPKQLKKILKKEKFC